MAVQKKIQRTFRAPKGVTEFQTITIREIDGSDEELAAELAGRRGKSDMRSFFNEQVRISIVDVDGVKVNVNDVPFREIDNWRSKARTAVGRFHSMLNGVDSDDLDACVAEGMGLLPPSNQAQAPSGSSDTSSGG